MTPSVTTDLLIGELYRHSLMSEQDLVSLLGAERVGVSLNTLELRLVDNNVLSEKRLAQLLGLISGRGVVEDDAMNFRADLAPNIAQSTGALVVDREPLTVAFVEDLPSNVDLVALTLNTTTFEVWLMTASRFTRGFKAVYANEQHETFPESGDIFEVFDEALRRRASDIHLSVGVPPAIRVDGSPQYLRRRPLSAEWVRAQAQLIAGERGMTALEESTAYDFAYSYGSVRFRVNLGFDRFGVMIAARTLSSKVPAADALGLPHPIRDLVRNERGLVLVTGPTGSGKSTTLASLLTTMATMQSRHIITLEDPIEYYLESGQSLVHQREQGRDFLTFPAALRQALRQDPDVILVGELRDYETTATAVTAAETGHLVFATMHTYDAASTVSRLVSVFPPEEQDQIRAQLSYVLRGIVSQTLLPLASGKGRVAAFEIMLNNPAIRANIRLSDGHTKIHQVIETSVKEGMCTMDMSLSDLVLRGIVRETDAEEKVRDIEDFRRRVSRGAPSNGV